MQAARAAAARFGVDRTVALSVITRGVQGGATAATLALVLLRLSPAEQGFFFTMSTLGALQMLAEFGLAYALMQVVSHFGDRDDPAMLHALGHRARVRNAVTTAAGASIVWTIGHWLLGVPNAQAQAGISWQGPWLALVAGVALYQQFFPAVALAEGAGRTAVVWKWRAEQELVGGAGVVVALVAGAGLYALPAGYVARLVHAVATNARLRLPEARDVELRSVDSAEQWRSIWRLQWRIGISSVANLLLLQLLGPLLFAVAGPVVGGRVGLAIVLGNGAFGLTTGWLASQAPTLGRDFAERRWERFDTHFATLLRNSMTFAALVATLVCTVVLGAALLFPALVPRIPPATVLVPVMAAAVLHHFIFAHATRLRASGREPFLVLYAGGAVVTAACLALVALHGSAAAVAATYFGLSLGGALIAAGISRRARGRWDDQPRIAGTA